MKVTVDTSQFKQLARDLLKAAPAAEAASLKAMLAAAELVKRDAVMRVSAWPTKAGNGSARIAGAIRVRMVSRNRVVVEVDGAQAPEAAPIENRGKGNVRHPVFGHRDRMTNKGSHPAFLAPAREQARPVAEAAIEKAGVEAVRREVTGR